MDPAILLDNFSPVDMDMWPTYNSFLGDENLSNGLKIDATNSSGSIINSGSNSANNENTTTIVISSNSSSSCIGDACINSASSSSSSSCLDSSASASPTDIKEENIGKKIYIYT